jgi:predicted RNA-binding protein with RPS1 domain
MELKWGIQGLVHLSEISHGVVKDIRDYVKVGEEVKAKIINFDPKKKRIGLSLKALQEAPKKEEKKSDDKKTEEKVEKKAPAKKAPAKKTAPKKTEEK